MASLLIAGGQGLAGQPVVLAAVGGAAFDPNLAPGSIITIFGQQLATGVKQAESLPLPPILVGTSVEIGGIAAPLYYVSPGAINAQIPFEVKPGAAELVVRGKDGASLPYPITVTPSAAAIFSVGSNGKGRGIMFDANFQETTALKPGDSLIFYATGLGATNPPANSGFGGSDVEPFNRVASLPELYIGDTKARILFAGLAPGFAGVYQINAQIPAFLATDRTFFKLGNYQSNVVSFARSYPGTETVYVSNGPAGGTTFDYDAGVPATTRSIVQAGVELATAYYTSAGFGDLGTAHIFALNNLVTLSGIYSQWKGLSLDVANANLQNNDAETGAGVTWLSAFRTDWTQASAASQTHIIVHECFHLLQNKLDPQGIAAPTNQIPLNGPRWIVEGSAEYMSYRATAANGLTPFSDALAQETDQARRVRVALHTLDTLPGLQAAGPTEGYALMFMAFDFLASKRPLTSIATYYSLIGQGTLWPQAFQTAFNETVDQFYLEFEQYRADHFPPYALIRGTVTDVSSAPYPGISVYACAVSPRGPCGYALTDASGQYAVNSPDGGFTVSFGRSTDGNKYDGFYSSQGLVADASKATIVNVHGADVQGIDVRMPFPR